MPPRSLLVFLCRWSAGCCAGAGAISLPRIFERNRQSLLPHTLVAVPGVAREHVLVVIALLRQHLRHALVGQDPVVHAVAHEIRVEQIAIADFQPDADRLGGTLWD